LRREADEENVVPIFDYSCAACGHTFDVLQKLGADPLTDCPECHAAELQKLLSAPAFHLKGKGWKNSDESQKKPNIRPKFAHTMDSPVAHAEHDHAGPSIAKGGGHTHHENHGHSHANDGEHGRTTVTEIAKKIAKSSSHDHGHSHGHSHSHKDGHDH
jgi:putative FmdB family regulatory protein